MEKLDKLNFDLSTFLKDTLRDLSDKVLTHTPTFDMNVLKLWIYWHG